MIIALLIISVLMFLFIIGFQIYSDISLLNLKSKKLCHLMEVEYKGNFNKIKRNYHMFCTYYDYINENYIIKDEDRKKEVFIKFKLKDKNIDKNKLCKKFLMMKKNKHKEFFEKYYDIKFEIL